MDKKSTARFNFSRVPNMPMVKRRIAHLDNVREGFGPPPASPKIRNKKFGYFFTFTYGYWRRCPKGKGRWGQSLTMKVLDKSMEVMPYLDYTIFLPALESKRQPSTQLSFYLVVDLFTALRTPLYLKAYHPDTLPRCNCQRENLPAAVSG